MNVSISLHTQLEWTRPGNRARPQISPLIGEVAPAFSLPSLSGDLIQLSDFLGSPTLLLFWRPSCDFCQRMLEALRGWEDQPPANRPKLLVVSSESKQDNLALGLRSPIVLDEEGLPVSRLYGAVGTPMGVLIDEQGKIASEVMAGKRAVLALAGVRSELNFSLPSQRQQTQSEASGTDEAGHQARAPRPPKIFGIGLSRTGTTSLTEALTLLGYRTLHFPWDEVTRAELYQFLACHPASAQLSVLQVADAITDTPACCLYQALDQAYAGSKFILTVREKSAWLRSCAVFWRRVVEPHARTIAAFGQYSYVICEQLYGTQTFEAEQFSQAYDRYVAGVLTYFQDRETDLLILDICGGQGWDTLAPFLDKTIPPLPFPWKNRDPDHPEQAQTKSEASGSSERNLPRPPRIFAIELSRTRLDVT